MLHAEDDEDLDAQLFDDSRHWRETQPAWSNPEAGIGQRQFFEVLEACIEQLPPVQGRVFLMREWLELGTEEICKEVSISATNLWVLLHRARLRLRECLQAQWFGNPNRSRRSS